MPSAHTLWNSTPQRRSSEGEPLHHAMQASTLEQGISIGHANEPFGVLSK